MTYSSLPLSYCTNVHPGRTVAEVLHGLTQYTRPLAQNCGGGVAAGLWLARSVVQEILDQPDGIRRFRDQLHDLQLTCYSLNAFPYGDFHSERVKEQVYLPHWGDPHRRAYTEHCATILTELLPDHGEGSISTLPLGFKGFAYPADFTQQAIAQLLQTARFLHQLHQSSGKQIRLAIEPEPYCLLETTPEAITFFRQLYQAADSQGLGDLARNYLGLCYDVCHQSVEFEDIAQSIHSLTAAEIRLAKIHITCALRLPEPARNPEAQATLGHYVEPRYLHQMLGRLPNGQLLRSVDLSYDWGPTPPAEWLQASEWRIHFHVPVHATQLGPLQTTRPDLITALKSLQNLEYAPHLEVETYTWGVLPDRQSPSAATSLVDGLTQEILATRTLLNSLTSTTPSVHPDQ